MEFISNSPEQTKHIAADFARTLKGGEVIFLGGDLGTGKTTFVQGLAKALGYDGPVRSPTFTLMNIYQTNHPTISKIVHADLYRLKEKDELQALALDEQMNSSTVMLIEWPGLIEKKFDPSSIHIQMRQTSEHERTITIPRPPHAESLRLLSVHRAP